MFSHTAQYYDLLYGFKDYRVEADGIRAIVTREHPTARTVLDVACGTAEHDRFLADTYSVDGVDINQEFVDIAKTKNPRGTYSPADMAEFDLGRRYDVVMCLFSSIGYLKTPERVAQALTCLREHLNPGGVVLVEPWFTPDAWHPGNVHLLTAETDAVKICRMNRSETEGNISVLHFHYLVGTAEGVTHLEEYHELGLFTVEQMKCAFESAGLAVRYDAGGLTDRGMYVARVREH